MKAGEGDERIVRNNFKKMSISMFSELKTPLPRVPANVGV